MDILLINPNTTARITDLVLAFAASVAAPGTRLRAATGAFGGRYIASRAAYAVAGHAALDALSADTGPRDAVVLACFGDPGLDALKEICEVPVVGMAEASILHASAVGARFSIVTGGERWGPMLREFVAGRGLERRLASVRTMAPTGADIARDPDGSLAMLRDGCMACAREDGADVVILGGAGLAGLAARIQPGLDVPVLDGVACAVAFAEGLVRASAGGAGVRPPPPLESVGLSPALAAALAGAGGRVRR